MALILASTSPYRAALLARLELPFTQVDPAFAEVPGAGEPALALCQRLARGKAESAALRAGEAIIIGSDQVACLDDALLGKPGNAERAIEQLHACAGHWVSFHTAVCVLNHPHQQADVRVDSYEVRFRDLSDDRIRDYVARDQPFDCAGSLRAEGLGITLIAEMRGRDLNTLLGLPLILLVDMLLDAGISI